MSTVTYLVFGDLHGRVLPAFRLAQAWEREHNIRLSGLLQVGDLGYFPDHRKLDKATIRHAKDDPLELGVREVVEGSQLADRILQGEEPVPEGLWFTPGNHEDYEELKRREKYARRDAASFVVDGYCRVFCLRDGMVETLPGGLRVGALWGIDGRSPRARVKTPAHARIKDSSAIALACAEFDVLLTHESPRDAVLMDSGSDEISAVIHSVQPGFAFFGHYGSRFGRIEGPYGATAVHEMAGMELRQRGHCAEEGSVGVLTWGDEGAGFEYLNSEWLQTFTRSNWQHR